MKPIPNSAQMELFPDLAKTLPDAEEQEMQQMIKTSRLNTGANGTRADDLQVGGQHYKEMGIQPWAVMEAVLTHEEFIGFLKGNVIKYGMRQGKKGTEDSNKAQHYAMKLKEIQHGNRS